jgi:quinoprotein glucose dehydrogenase
VGVSNAKCRGVAYYHVPGATGACASRVYVASIDGRLIAVDSRTGEVCAGFGVGGIVSLLDGITQRSPGYYNVTSAPLLADGKLIVGGRVADGQYVGEPSGVVRAFDAVTGRLAWAWDVGNPDNIHGPAPGQSYTPGTPNVWGPMSADEALGLIYLPTANATPDRWAGYRTEASNSYGSGVAALEAATGKLRWFFQTVHHDLWDYDVASQPILYDMPTPHGVVPALIQPTKQGQVFVLDRRDGKPLFPVKELPVPQAGAVEHLSPTQPFSTGFADLAGARIDERSMWGLTALDQLWCRIQFRKARYQGIYTPPGLVKSLQYPGSAGGVNWASAAIDPVRGLAFFSTNHMISDVRLMTRQEADRAKLKATPGSDLGGPVAQEGAPYAADVSMFFSPIYALCKAPPYGRINAVDLKTGKMVWSRPLGSARDLGPAMFPSHLPFTLGTPLLGGPLTTAGGLVLVAGSVDRTLRAFDSETGALLFEHDVPGFHNGTVAMSYRDGAGHQIIAITSTVRKNGRPYVAITAFSLPPRH